MLKNFFGIVNSSQEIKKLINTLEHVCTRLEHGETLNQATHQMPNDIMVGSSLIHNWSTIKKHVEDGKGTALASVESFLDNLKIKNELQELIKEKSLLPKVQAYVISFLCFFIICSSYFIFPDFIKPSPMILFSSLCLVFIGFVIIHLFLKQYEKRLWFSDWIIFLNQIMAHMSWGLTLAPSLKEAQKLCPQENWPKELKEIYYVFNQTIRQSLSIKPSFLKILKRNQKNQDRQLAYEHLYWIARLYNQSQPMSQSIDKLSNRSRKYFHTELKKQSDLLSFQLLLPLFVFFLPAIFILLIGNIILQLH